MDSHTSKTWMAPPASIAQWETRARHLAGGLPLPALAAWWLRRRRHGVNPAGWKYRPSAMSMTPPRVSGIRVGGEAARPAAVNAVSESASEPVWQGSGSYQPGRTMRGEGRGTSAIRGQTWNEAASATQAEAACLTATVTATTGSRQRPWANRRQPRTLAHLT